MGMGGKRVCVCGVEGVVGKTSPQGGGQFVLVGTDLHIYFSIVRGVKCVLRAVSLSDKCYPGVGGVLKTLQPPSPP